MPEPFYDPLALAVEEACRRGMELHAWINVYSGFQNYIWASRGCNPGGSALKPSAWRTYGALALGPQSQF